MVAMETIIQIWPYGQCTHTMHGKLCTAYASDYTTHLPEQQVTLW